MALSVVIYARVYLKLPSTDYLLVVGTPCEALALMILAPYTSHS